MKILSHILTFFFTVLFLPVHIFSWVYALIIILNSWAYREINHYHKEVDGYPKK